MEPRRSQAARSQAARDQIARAALTVFALKGYGPSSMDDICLAAGCSKGGLYHHFRTKGAVLSAVVERLAARNALLPPFDGVGDADGAGTGDVVGPAIGRVLIEVWAEAARDAGLRDQLGEAYRALSGSQSTGEGSLGHMLRIGALVQLLTRGEAVDADALAERLGIERAA